MKTSGILLLIGGLFVLIFGIAVAVLGTLNSSILAASALAATGGAGFVGLLIGGVIGAVYILFGILLILSGLWAEKKTS